MPVSLAFDIYGTLIDTHGLTSQLQGMIGEDAEHFSRLWRDKQLEYSFRRGLMNEYQDFSTCTRDALEYCSQSRKTPLTESEKQMLLNAYQKLPAFSDVETCLAELQNLDYRLFAFSNGRKATVKSLLSNASLDHYFIDIISVDSIQTFKPNPKVYHYFLKQTKSQAKQTFLISSNSFDVLGAMAIDMQAVWVRRHSNQVFDPWGHPPSKTIENLNELKASLRSN